MWKRRVGGLCDVGTRWASPAKDVGPVVLNLGLCGLLLISGWLKAGGWCLQLSLSIYSGTVLSLRRMQTKGLLCQGKTNRVSDPKKKKIFWHPSFLWGWPTTLLVCTDSFKSVTLTLSRRTQPVTLVAGHASRRVTPRSLRHKLRTLFRCRSF